MGNETEKIYLDAQQLLQDAFRLGRLIVDSGFRPSFMVAVWRGGVPIGIAVQEILTYYGMETDHIAIRTASYSGIDQQSREIRVDGLDYLIRQANHEDSLLIVDDVFDTGRSVEAIIAQLRARARLNTPHDIRVAVPYYKPSRNQTDRAPDYYLYRTDGWLKYPHSLEGLSREEIRLHRPGIYAIIKDYL